MVDREAGGLREEGGEMLAAVFLGPRQLVLRDIPRPVPGPGEVLVQVKACSICGTDRKIYKYGHRKIRTGEERILGHELAGQILEIGEGVDYYRPGMRVAVAPNVGCGYCPVCREGMEQLCPEYNAFGITWPGGFAEYLLIPRTAVVRGNLVEIPEPITYLEAALIEPLACCLAAREAMNIAPGASLLILGAGPMGNLHLMLNKHLGVGLTIVADLDKHRLEFSRQLGADFVLENDVHLKDNVLDITHGRGVDAVIIAASVPELIEQAFSVVAIMGTINVFGGMPTGKEWVRIDANAIHYRQVKLLGTTGATRAQFYRASMLISNSKLDLRKIVTKKIKLPELGFVLDDDALMDENMKIVVEF